MATKTLPPIYLKLGFTLTGSAQYWTSDGTTVTEVAAVGTTRDINRQPSASGYTGWDGVGHPSGDNQTRIHSGVALSAPNGLIVPEDFVSMTTLVARYSSFDYGGRVDDFGYFQLKLVNGTTNLAGDTSGGLSTRMDYFDQTNWTATTQGATGTAPAKNKTNAFAYVNGSASKSTWNGATLTMGWVDTRNMGSDNSAIVLHALRFEGTYSDT